MTSKKNQVDQNQIYLKQMKKKINPDLDFQVVIDENLIYKPEVTNQKPEVPQLTFLHLSHMTMVLRNQSKQ